jgi:DNA replication and repair protein RecF
VHVTHLSLVDFRSYPKLDLLLGPGVTTFVGANGQGKTNLLEAVGYLATLGSHRVANDGPLIREGAERAAVRARIVKGERAALAEIEIVPGKANRAKLNRSPLPRPRELIGLLCTVLFAPEDLALVRGDPGERRRYLDSLLISRLPRFAGVCADYDRVLRQRSALLRSAGAARRGGRPGDLRTLDSWDGLLAEQGARLLAARLELVSLLAERVEHAYGALVAPTAGADEPSPPREPLTRMAPLTRMEYRSSVPAATWTPAAAGEAPPPLPERATLEAAMLAELARVRPQEVERGVTLVGPHRDELALSVNGRPARGYASHGEGWSLALALRLAAYDLLRDEGREPVLLLDDVFAELDERRRRRLAALVGSAEQVLVTAAVDGDVPAELAGARFTVAGGAVTPAGSPDGVPGAGAGATDWTDRTAEESDG